MSKQIPLHRKIYYWWSFEGKYMHKMFLKGCKNLVKWFPVIWKDRDYDHNYIYYVIKFKLDKQSKYLEYKDRFVSTKRKVRYMRICSSLLDKLINDSYSEEYHKYIDYNFKSKLSDEKDDNGEFYYVLDVEKTNDRLDEYFEKYKLLYKKFSNETDRSLIGLKISSENHKRARKLLFKILEEEIEGWWD